MKTVLFLVLAVALMAAVLTPVAIARAASWKWNSDKIQRTLPDGTAAVLKILYSQGVYSDEVRKGSQGLRSLLLLHHLQQLERPVLVLVQVGNT